MMACPPVRVQLRTIHPIVPVSSVRPDCDCPRPVLLAGSKSESAEGLCPFVLSRFPLPLTPVTLTVFLKIQTSRHQMTTPDGIMTFSQGQVQT